MAGKSILIIDDDVDFSRELSESLSAAGYFLKIINNSFEAYRDLIDNSYNLILLDYKMPGLNGIDLLKLVSKTRPLTKVFIITGRPLIEKLLAAESAAAMVAGVIYKPFKVEDLLEKIKSVFPE